ncbi:MAG: cytochrome c biogenesis protein CcdA, partial [bacterium]|nr:cytochrome c biogenesis protein CcdA [bacterium]
METTSTISFLGAFTAGFLSFLTPCVLPLVPVYLSILSGTSFNQMLGKDKLTPEETRAIHKRVLSNAIMFILGFSLVFIALGLVSGQIGKLLTQWGF